MLEGRALDERLTGVQVLEQELLLEPQPAGQAREGTRLAVEYLGEPYPVTVAVAGATPLFDPENQRVRS